MNTSKQVNVMIGLMFVFLIGTLLYFLWDSVRAEDAQERQLVDNAERGGALFALNCRICHGLSGLGTLENANLPGVPLNIDTNRPDDPGKLLERQSRVLDTIRCGRVGTLMPAWAEDQGGPLNPFQIQQLVALITGAMPGLDPPDNANAVSEKGWEAALEAAVHADLLEGKKLAEAVGAEDTVFVLSDAQKLNIGSLLRIDEEVVRIADAPAGATLGEDIDESQTDLAVKRAGELFGAGDIVQIEDERLRVVRASEDALTVERGVDRTRASDHQAQLTLFELGDQIEVERAAFATQAAEHEAGAQLFAGPLEPPTEPLVGEDGIPPCGQLPAAPQASPSPPIPIEGAVTMELGDNFFRLQDQSPPALGVKVGQDVTISLVNNGQAVHNMHVAGTGNAYAVDFCEVGGEEPCSDPAAIAAGQTAAISFQFDQAGTFAFRCDFHPTVMTGEIVVSE